MMHSPGGAAVFAAAYVALYVAHDVADHWVQTSHQAAHKGLRGWAGARACAAHVATYLAAQAVALGAVVAVLDLPVTPARVGLALLVSGVTHYIADRRYPLAWMAQRLHRAGYAAHCTVIRSVGGGPDTTGPGTGGFHLDQAYHHLWVGIAALLLAA